MVRLLGWTPAAAGPSRPAAAVFGMVAVLGGHSGRQGLDDARRMTAIAALGFLVHSKRNRQLRRWLVAGPTT